MSLKSKSLRYLGSAISLIACLVLFIAQIGFLFGGSEAKAQGSVVNTYTAIPANNPANPTKLKENQSFNFQIQLANTAGITSNVNIRLGDHITGLPFGADEGIAPTSDSLTYVYNPAQSITPLTFNTSSIFTSTGLTIPNVAANPNLVLTIKIGTTASEAGNGLIVRGRHIASSNTDLPIGIFTNAVIAGIEDVQVLVYDVQPDVTLDTYISEVKSESEYSFYSGGGQGSTYTNFKNQNPGIDYVFVASVENLGASDVSNLAFQVYLDYQLINYFVDCKINAGEITQNGLGGGVLGSTSNTQAETSKTFNILKLAGSNASNPSKQAYIIGCYRNSNQSPFPNGYYGSIISQINSVSAPSAPDIQLSFPINRSFLIYGTPPDGSLDTYINLISSESEYSFYSGGGQGSTYTNFKNQNPRIDYIYSVSVDNLGSTNVSNINFQFYLDNQAKNYFVDCKINTGEIAQAGIGGGILGSASNEQTETSKTFNIPKLAGSTINNPSKQTYLVGCYRNSNQSLFPNGYYGVAVTQINSVTDPNYPNGQFIFPINRSVGITGTPFIPGGGTTIYPNPPTTPIKSPESNKIDKKDESNPSKNEESNKPNPQNPIVEKPKEIQEVDPKDLPITFKAIGQNTAGEVLLNTSLRLKKLLVKRVYNFDFSLANLKKIDSSRKNQDFTCSLMAINPYRGDKNNVVEISTKPLDNNLNCQTVFIKNLQKRYNRNVRFFVRITDIKTGRKYISSNINVIL